MNAGCAGGSTSVVILGRRWIDRPLEKGEIPGGDGLFYLKRRQQRSDKSTSAGRGRLVL